MPGLFSVNLLGDKELLAKLDRLSNAAGKRVLREAIREASKPVIREAKARVPIDSGGLKKSLGSRFRFYRGTGTDVVTIGPRVRRGEEKIKLTGWISTKTTVIKALTGYHGYIVEYGTAPRYTKSGAFRGIGPAQPFMRPAWDLKRQEAERIGVAVLRRAVEREAKRGG